MPSLKLSHSVCVQACILNKFRMKTVPIWMADATPEYKHIYHNMYVQTYF